MSDVTHSDNTCVKRGKDGCDYFAVSFHPTEEPYRPYEVAIFRYCVPGRVDTYHFDWMRGYGGKLRYGTEIRTAFNGPPIPLPKALAMLAKDLDKPDVVELLVEAVTPEERMHYSRQLIDFLLLRLAPKSKAYRACKKAYDAMYAARVARFAAQREVENAKTGATCILEPRS